MVSKWLTIKTNNLHNYDFNYYDLILSLQAIIVSNH